MEQVCMDCASRFLRIKFLGLHYAPGSSEFVSYCCSSCEANEKLVLILVCSYLNVSFPIFNFRYLTAAGYGTASVLLFVYLTDWELPSKYIPYYGGKFAKEEKKET